MMGDACASLTTGLAAISWIGDRGVCLLVVNGQAVHGTRSRASGGIGSNYYQAAEEAAEEAATAMASRT